MRIEHVLSACAMGCLFLCATAHAQVTHQEMQQQAVKPNSAMNVPASYNGKLSGIVYWDTTKIVRNTSLIYMENGTSYTLPVPPGCDGTQIDVVFADPNVVSSWQTGTQTFSYSTNGSLAICAYTIDHVPIGQPLLVAAFVPSVDYSLKAGITTDGDMAAVPVPGDNATWWYTWDEVGGVGASVTVVSTPCRDLVSSASISSALGSRSCSGDAVNVNFVIGSYSDYLKTLFSGNGGSAQQLSAAQARVMAQVTRPRQALSGGALRAQSAKSTTMGVSVQRTPMSPATTRLVNPGSPQTPISGTTPQRLLANGGKSGTLLGQPAGTTNGTMADRSPVTVSRNEAAVTANGVAPLNGGSKAQPVPVPSKGDEQTAYEAVTVERGETHDPSFTNWAKSGQASPGPVNAQAAAVGARSADLTPALVGAACAKDPSLRILGVTGSAEAITFVPGHSYTIWGCSFGPENPNNEVYLSDGGPPGSAFTWYCKKLSWGDNSVVVKVSAAPSSARSNLMLFVLGRNGNTKLDGVTLKSF